VPESVCCKIRCILVWGYYKFEHHRNMVVLASATGELVKESVDAFIIPAKYGR
jgi:hypothetical protein